MTANRAPDILVPFADLHQQYVSIKPDIDAAIAATIQQSDFIRGPQVDAFETAFAAAIGVNCCVSCGNGTDALYIAMVSLGVQPGDEIIVPAMSWISTSETVSQAGGTVIFCDIDPKTNTLDPARLEACITDKTVGIIPVHLYGHPADMDSIKGIAAAHSLWIIEDCAQAHLAEYKGRQVGTFGKAATFSFYPGKNLGAMGDAGAVVTNDKALADKMAKFARHGGLRKGDHEIEGINSRLDGLQAAILNVKLPSLNRWTEMRRRIAMRYCDGLSHIAGLTLPIPHPDTIPVWHLFVVQSERRDDLREHLLNGGIQTSINYPRALPDLPCYRDKGHDPSQFPVAGGLAKNGLSLPIYPEMTAEQVEHVIQSVRVYFEAENG